jgi:hypothetical protein
MGAGGYTEILIRRFENLNEGREVTWSGRYMTRPYTFSFQTVSPFCKPSFVFPEICGQKWGRVSGKM